MPVNAPRHDYTEILPKWNRIRDCFGGRDTVLSAGAKYVPLLPGADANANKAYRERGNFYNALARTVGGMNGAIFQEAPDVSMPTSAQPLLDDITLTNVSFESFSTEIGKETVMIGRYGVLVDMPVQPIAVGATPRLIADMRPYCVGFCAENIVNWRTERIDGDQILTLVVLSEEISVPDADDLFTQRQVCQYRVLLLRDGKCMRQLWQQKQDNDKEYAMIEEVALMRRGEPLTFIPFYFFGALTPTPDIEVPPLMDLADINLAHWRNSVDHEYGLHLVALPTPWMSGGKGGDDGPKKMGPSVVWELELQGSAGMLEFTGKGLEAIVAAMDEKKKQMATLGARLIEDAPSVGETASAVKLRHSSETASLKTIAQSLEEGLVQVLQACLWWEGTEATPQDTEVEVELNKEYLNVRATPQEMQVALLALQAGELSFETWYNLLITGGWAREGVDVEQEQKDIKKRVPDVMPPDPNADPGVPGNSGPSGPGNTGPSGASGPSGAAY